MAGTSESRPWFSVHILRQNRPEQASSWDRFRLRREPDAVQPRSPARFVVYRTTMTNPQCSIFERRHTPGPNVALTRLDDEANDGQCHLPIGRVPTRVTSEAARSQAQQAVAQANQAAAQANQSSRVAETCSVNFPSSGETLGRNSRLSNRWA